MRFDLSLGEEQYDCTAQNMKDSSGACLENSNTIQEIYNLLAV